jgi:hypothetical protein
MDLERSAMMAQHARRGLRWQVVGLFASSATAVLAALAARTNPLSAVVVALCGIGSVFAARSLRAAGTLLQLVQPPSPKWISRVVPLALVVGLLTVAIGLWLLFQHWRPGP